MVSNSDLASVALGYNQETTQEMDIAPGIHQLNIPIPDNPLGHLNCYLIEGKDGWLMVDTGWCTPDAFEAMEKGLRALGLVLTDIATMVLTHVHLDHFGLAGRIKHVSPGTELLTHHWESALIESSYVNVTDLSEKMLAMFRQHGVPPISPHESASIPAFDFFMITFPDRVLYGGETISTGVYDLEVIWTPGHAPGHICLYEPKNRILFSGDHILPSTTPNVSYHVQSGDNPLSDYLYSLHKIRNLRADKVLPAHEHIFSDLKGRIRQIFDHHNRRKDEIQHAISKEPQNAYEISTKITWDLDLSWEQFPTLLKLTAVRETLAHLEWMRWEGIAQRIIRDESVCYGLSE